MKFWKTVTASAVLGVAVSSVASADSMLQRELFSDPTARVYFSLGFDRPAETHRPLHFGLRVDGDNHRDWAHRPAIAQFDFDRAGLRHAAMNGMPVLQRDFAQHADEGELVYNWADWGLIAAGVVGLGFIIYELADSDSGSAPQPDPDAGGGPGGGDGGGLLGGLLADGSTADRAAALSMSGHESRTWRDGGTGQMGDLD